MISSTTIPFPEVSLCGISEKGLKRPSNEDHFLIAQFSRDRLETFTNVPDVDESRSANACPNATLLMIADGVGGARFGAYCSQFVLHRMFDLISEQLQDSPSEFEYSADALRLSVLRVRQELLAEASENPNRLGMATTLTAILVVWPKWYLVHVGDSRCYLMHNNTMRQLTVDHSLAESMKSRVQENEQASLMNLRHVIWNSVSASHHECVPDTSSGMLHEGDALLLCTDGLTLHVENNEMAGIMAEEASGHAICDRLTSLTIDRGARDNVAVVAARFGELSLNVDGK